MRLHRHQWVPVYTAEPVRVRVDTDYYDDGGPYHAPGWVYGPELYHLVTRTIQACSHDGCSKVRAVTTKEVDRG